MKEKPERQGFMYEPLPHERLDAAICDVQDAFAYGAVIIQRSEHCFSVYSRDLSETHIDWVRRK